MAGVRLSVNGVGHELDLPAEMPLLWALRGPVGDRSPKYGCGTEQCGSCRVLVDGSPRFSCRLPVADVDGSEITTTRGLVDDPAGACVIAALLGRNAGQCGYCLPGIVVSLAHVLRRGDRPDRPALAAALDDHLCRCGAQPRILDAAVDAVEAWHGR